MTTHLEHVDAMSAPLKRYFIVVGGREGVYIAAPTASKARYQIYRRYREILDPRICFRDFLGMIETFHHLGVAT